MQKFKDRFSAPLKHLQSFTEPDGYNYQTQLGDTYRMHGNSAQQMSASITNNALELNSWHEMESTVHSQFGTIDNPVLIFTSDSSWRIVICMGPGIEDDAHSHEKIFYMVREGPINRCQVCGQCFKIVRLKDEFNELQDYYTMMFSTVSHFDVAEEDIAINMTSLFNDRPQATMQSIPATNVYIHVNSDEADRILVDPAYKLDRLKEAHEKLYAMHQSYKEVDRQMKDGVSFYKRPMGRDQYENWMSMEMAIRKFDRIFNKVEKFNARKLSDPDNHARREGRMLDSKKKRWTDNYTYFFGGLTEEEQQYKDYFETDIEGDFEDEALEEFYDRDHIANMPDANPKQYDFIETSLYTEVHEVFEDLVEDKIFQFKYRQNGDDRVTYQRRQQRMMKNFFERARVRDQSVEVNLDKLYAENEKSASIAALLVDTENYKAAADDGTTEIREYMVKEGVQQFRDYYESDAEEQGFFEYLDNLTNRDQIRFLECFEDFTLE